MNGQEKTLKNLQRLGNAACLDFVNTLRSHLDADSHDYIPTYEDLLEWAVGGALIDRPTGVKLKNKARRQRRQSQHVHRRAIELRGYLYRIFLALARGKTSNSRDLKVLNGWLHDVFGRREIALANGGFRWQIGGQESLESPLWPVVLSAGDLLVTGLYQRVKECPADDCGWLFLDTSKNASRKWCSMETCGNVAKARRYYDRHARGQG